MRRYSLHWTRRAEKAFQRLDKSNQERIIDAFKNLVDYYEKGSGNPPDVKRLHGKYKGLFRLRVGNLRAVFKVEKDRLIIIVIDILPRGDAYKN